MKMKLKGSHFDTTEVIEAETQVVLNTLTEHNFQDAFKNWQKCWEWYIHMEGEYFECTKLDVQSILNFSFRQKFSPEDLGTVHNLIWPTAVTKELP
jgi:hypothetical protein